MKPNKINTNRPQIDSKEIESLKSFDDLLQQYQTKGAKPIYKNRWFITSTTGVAIIITVIVLMLSNNKKVAISRVQQKHSNYINPPIPKANIKQTVISIPVEKDTILLLPSGSTILIPSNSIVGTKNKTLTGNIEIRYREFNDPASIFLSGIPMQYDSAGNNYTFESAGMIEIAAYQDNKRLEIHPDKPITVNIVSNNPNHAFNAYLLDTIKRNWQYLGKPEIIKSNGNNNKQVTNLKNNTNTHITKSELIIPIAPIKANPQKWNIKLDFIPKEFPELLSYNEMVFEVDRTFEKEDGTFSKTDWEDTRLEKTNSDNLYKLTLIKGKTVKNYFVRPVYEGQSYEKAKNVYDIAYAKYKSDLLKRIEEEEKIKKELTEKQNREKLEFEEKNRKLNELNRFEYIVLYNVSRKFNVRSFGIINYDYPIPHFRKDQQIIPSFKIENEIIKKNIFYVNQKQNALYTVLSNRQMYLSRDSKMLLWTVVDNKKIAIFSPSEFESIPKNAFKYEFTLHVLPQEIKKSDDFIKLYYELFKR